MMATRMQILYRLDSVIQIKPTQYVSQIHHGHKS